ncbi:hypothetical protein Droror1_Dr00020080 [Drosera rotundifolia]
MLLDSRRMVEFEGVVQGLCAKSFEGGLGLALDLLSLFSTQHFISSNFPMVFEICGEGLLGFCFGDRFVRCFFSALIDVSGHAGNLDAAFNVLKEAIKMKTAVQLETLEKTYQGLLGLCIGDRFVSKYYGGNYYLHKSKKSLSCVAARSGFRGGVMVTKCSAAKEQLKSAKEDIKELIRTQDKKVKHVPDLNGDVASTVPHGDSATFDETDKAAGYLTSSSKANQTEGYPTSNGT